MNSTRRNLLQHQCGALKGSLWLLASSPLKVNFSTVLAKKAEQVRVYAEKLNDSSNSPWQRRRMENGLEKCEILQGYIVFFFLPCAKPIIYAHSGGPFCFSFPTISPL